MIRPKKILFITHLYYPSVGGAERVFRRLAEGLAGRGHRVTVLTSDALSTEQFFTRAQNDLPLRETVNGVEVIRGPIQASAYRTLEFFDKVARRASLFGVFFRPLVFGPHFPLEFKALAGTSFDALIAGPVPSSSTFYGLRYKRKHPDSVLCFFPCLHFRDRLHKTFVNLWALRQGNKVFVLSRAEGSYLAGRGVRPDRIHRLVVGVDEHILQEHAPMEEALEDYVLYLGQEGWHKKIPLLIRAMRSLWNRGFSHPLVIAGARAGYSRHLDRIIAELPAGERGKIFRYNDISEDRKISLLSHCLVLVNPSSYESFGIVFLEASARRRPVIGADIDAVREVVKDGLTGFLFEDRNAADLEAKILRLAEDKDLALRMGEAGHRDVLAHYRWEDIIRKVEASLFASF
jgi:glycosyltransferase involved in cell wall biosynthesis